jgi:predicted ABC-type ATPase
VPEETIRRRYQRSLENFFRLYQPLTDAWEFYDNEKPESPRLLAIGNGTIELVEDERSWLKIKGQVKP